MNDLRRRVWEIDEQIAQLLRVAPEFRNSARIASLEEEGLRCESEIKRLRAAHSGGA
ncbi:hypothetical protein [Marinobacterium litorale]|uniref:hypothetical protein n=1 Tax=Marinobacterium litorale TaxID=404770 RepID=UPI0012EB29D8|nr:hypothetical protein [Marinobacterium litorale]